MSDEFDFECTLCGAMLTGESFGGEILPPEKCYVCGAPKSDLIDYRQAEENRRINAKED